MKCEEFLSKIDAYIDGELTNEEINDMRIHARGCEACRMEMESAEFLRATLDGFDDNIAVPLEAQAAWRRAVRNEAKAKNTKKWTRAIYAVAAALVVVLGCTLALNNDIFADKRVDMPEVASLDLVAADEMFIAADGAEVSSVGGAESYTAVKKFAVESFETADKLIADLAAEYGCIEMVKTDSGSDIAYCIEIPADYQADFLSAASVLGNELNSEVYDSDADTAVIRINLVEG